MTASIPASYIGRVGGGEAPIGWYQETNSLALKAGQFVNLNGGQLEAASGTSDILGMLAADARNVTSDSLQATPVILATPDALFEMQVFHSTAANSVTSISMIGKSYALKQSIAAGVDGLDIETAANAADQFTVVMLSKKDAISATDGRVIVVVNATNNVMHQRIAH